MATEMFDARFRKTAFVVTVVVALVFGMLAPFMATLPEASAAPIGGKYGGNFKIALKAAPGAINPLASPDHETEQVIDLVYDSLARRDPATLELIPWIATSWTVDGLDVTVTVRDGVLWHDGSALTVTDVAYTYGLAGYAPASVASVASNASASTVTFTLSEPNGFFLIDGLLLKLVQDGFSAASEPMGCGPYMYDDASSDNSTLVIRAFDDYFDGRVYLDSITYTYYPGPIETVIYDLMNETIDAIGWNLEVTDLNKNVSFKGASLTLMAIRNSTFSPNWTIERSYGTEFLYLGYNCEPGNDLSNLALRQAITYCIDKTSISALDVSGSAKITDSIISSRNTPWYNTSIQKYNVDMAEANKIMDEAGYFDVNGDGFRERPDGTTFSLKFLVPPDTSTEEISLVTSGAIISVAVEKMGVNITPVNLPEADRIAAVEADEFDIFLGFEDRVRVSPATLDELFYSDKVATGSNRMNFAGTATEINGTVAVNATTGLGVMSRTNINQMAEIAAYRNGVLWGKAANHTIMVYDGADNITELGNTTITSVQGATLWRSGVAEKTLVSGTDYTLNTATGAFEILGPSGIQIDDVVNISYKYKTYENMDFKLGTIEVADNFNATVDTLTMCFDYRGVDDAVDKMRSTLSTANFTMHAKEAQGFLAEQVPLAPIMSYMVVNTFNKVTYTGWVSMLGGVFNFWSMKNLQHTLYDGKTLRTIAVSTTAYPGYVETGGVMDVDITVTDAESTPIEDAILEIDVTSGTLGEVTNNNDGTYSTTYTAPTVSATTDVTISTMAAKSGYISGFANTSVTVHIVTNLFVIEVTPAVNSMKSGNDTIISVLVTDEDTGLAVSGADVVVTVEPAGVGGWIEAGVGVTDAGGSFEVTLKTQNVSVDTTFRIVASVSKISYQPDEGTANVAVSKYGGESPDRGFLGLPGIGSLVSVAAIGLAAVLFAAARKRRK